MTRPSIVIGVLLLIGRATSAATVDEAEYLRGFEAADSTTLVALQGPLAAARGAERTAAAFANPAISVDREAPGNVEQWTYGLSWVPPLDFRRGPNIAASRAAADEARCEFAWNSLLARDELRTIYADWALAQERASIVQSYLGAFRSVVDKARERTRLGEESGLATQRLEIALVEMEAAAARVEADLVEKRALALGRSLVSFSDPQPALPALPAPREDDDWNAHPLLCARRAGVGAAEARARLGSRFVASPELRFGWQTLDEGGSVSDGPVVGGEWAIPLFDRRQGERLEWKGRLRAASARLAVVERQVRAEHSGADAKYRRLREAALATSHALAGSERVLERASARFQLGESDVTDLLEVTRSLISARMTGLELYGEALEAHRRLELAAGRILNDSPGGGR